MLQGKHSLSLSPPLRKPRQDAWLPHTWDSAKEAYWLLCYFPGATNMHYVHDSQIPVLSAGMLRVTCTAGCRWSNLLSHSSKKTCQGKPDKGRNKGFVGGEQSGESSHRNSGAGRYMGCYHTSSLSSLHNSGNGCSTQRDLQEEGKAKRTMSRRELQECKPETDTSRVLSGMLQWLNTSSWLWRADGAERVGMRAAICGLRDRSCCWGRNMLCPVCAWHGLMHQERS